MRKFSLTAIARHRLDHARHAPSGRSAETVVGGHEHALRHTLVALASGARMSVHHIDAEATVYVLSGRVRLKVGPHRWDARTGDLLTLSAPPDARLEAVEESAVLLTVVITLAHTWPGLPR